ncbi:DUF4202 domain-containing protein [Flammeovirgaceae bacterium SG7u.111]|nr:DUF4202 domain-containing protein [Flammeovirgaceae bacterium SG7u.132]WPO33003.1 DUF4202 domain-containing protein [Flammeovirgaceae bacterium SG7u.111]
MSKLENTLKAFDAANTEDPNKETWEGKEYPKELIYGQRMSEMLGKYSEGETPSETLQLASRCQHIRRWTIPRSDYPMDRKGYLKWRTQLKIFHGEEAGKIMAEHGYDEETIQTVKDLLMKKNLKKDPESQALEDVICLVFLQYYYDDFLAKHPEEKIIEILQKTWGKMTEKGHDHALQLQYTDKGLLLVKRALGLA